MPKKKLNYWREPNENKEPDYCIACNGSGYYDVTGSPKCSSCKGTGENLNKQTKKADH
jgi:DnaJ-class molecular chaperone